LTTSAGPGDPLQVQGYTLDGDGRADPGEAVAMTIALHNHSTQTLDDVQASIRDASPYVSLTYTAPITCGDLAAGQTKTASQPFNFQVSSDAPQGHPLTFTLVLSAAGAGPWLDELAMPVGGWRVYLPVLLDNHVRQRLPNDPHYQLLWALPTIRATWAWGYSISDPSITIAVLDTGVEPDHPDLQSKLWTNSDEIPSNGLDDDANGFVDDVHGYDFWNDDGDPWDDHEHGTHVAGTAAAATDNGTGVAALGWNSSLMPLKTQNFNGIGTTNELSEAILYAVDNGASVINVSVGQELTLCPSTLQAAIDYAHAHGVLVVAAVGNQDENPNKDFYPAACANVLGVAATGQGDMRIGSDLNPYVDVTAPGQDIYSTLRGGTYGYYSGTSMAAPLVAGLAALLYAHYPHYSDQQVAWAILGHALDLGEAGKDNYYGWGRIVADQALLRGATSAPDYQAGSAGTERGTNRGDFVPGELLLGWRSQSCPAGRAWSFGARLLNVLPQLEIWRVAVPVGQELAYLEAWQSNPCLAFVELNYVMRVVP
jgi:subtilisin family serine protease